MKNNDKINKKRIFSVILFAGILLAGVVYFFNHKEDFHLITKVSISAVIALSLLTIIMSLSYGLQLKILTDHYKMGINFVYCYGIFLSTEFVNLLLPFGGAASFKAVYLKKFHGFRYSSFLASMGIANIIKFMVNSLFALIFLGFVGKRISTILFVIVCIIFFCSLTFLLLAHKIRTYNLISLGFLKTIIDEWEKIRKDHKTIIRLICLSTFILFVTSFRIYLSFQAFSTDISFAASSIMAAFTIVTGALNLIPSNYGIREGIIIAIAGIHGIGINEGLHAAALGRILTIIWTLSITPLFMYNYSEKKERGNTVD